MTSSKSSKESGNSPENLLEFSSQMKQDHEKIRQKLPRVLSVCQKWLCNYSKNSKKNMHHHLLKALSINYVDSVLAISKYYWSEHSMNKRLEDRTIHSC